MIKWTDASVKKALKTMGAVIGNSDNMAGGTSGALQTDFPTSVSNVFTTSPKAAEVIEGDFVPGVVAGANKLKPVSGYNVFPFPAIGNTKNYVEGGGDEVMMFKRHAREPRSRQLSGDGSSPDDLGEARRLHRSGQDGPGQRVPGCHHPRDRHRGRQGEGVQVRPLRPPAGVVRRHGRPG